MEFISNFFSGISFELIAQLTMLAMIVIAGPVIVFYWRPEVATSKPSGGSPRLSSAEP